VKTLRLAGNLLTDKYSYSRPAQPVARGQSVAGDTVLPAEAFEMSNPIRAISLAKPAHKTAVILKNL
jgi:hypothetical protein